MQIPNRLKVIGDLIPDGAHIADIGADHGLLEHYIVLSKTNCSILAIENKIGPLSALRDSVECYKNVVVSHSDGMNQVTSDYETIVLAGMGGDNIIEILSKHPQKLKSVQNIIVDAHSFLPKVRKEIINFGFDIDCEKIVCEAKIFYVIISFKRNSKQKVYTEDEIDFGFKIYKDPLFKDYKKHILKEWKQIAQQLKALENQKEKYKAICEKIKRFKSYGQN